MSSRAARPMILSTAVACGFTLLLGCSESRDLTELGVPGVDGGVWYLEEMQKGADDGDSEGSAGTGGTSTGSGSSSSGGRGGTGGSSGGTAGSGVGGTGGSGSGGSGAGTGVPLPGGGGFMFPGQGGSGGFMFPGQGNQGGQMQPPPPPSEDVSSCSPCESLNGSLGGVPACCTDSNQCGADLSALGGSAGCVEREQPGTQTDQCPQVSIMNGGFQIPGCCLPSGRCGIVIMRLAPLGCIEPQVVEDLLQFDAPTGPAQPCR